MAVTEPTGAVTELSEDSPSTVSIASQLDVQVSDPSFSGDLDVNQFSLASTPLATELPTKRKRVPPWNTGKKLPAEVKARISATNKRIYKEKLEAQARALSVTVEEFLAERKRKREETYRSKLKGGFTPETRQRISARMVEAWQNSTYRENYTKLRSVQSPNKPDAKTRARISQSVRLLWTDPVHRARWVTRRLPVKTSTKLLLSERLRARWEEPSFRENMTALLFNPQSRERRATAVRQMWLDPAYSSKALNGMREYYRARALVLPSNETEAQDLVALRAARRMRYNEKRKAKRAEERALRQKAALEAAALAEAQRIEQARIRKEQAPEPKVRKRRPVKPPGEQTPAAQRRSLEKELRRVKTQLKRAAATKARVALAEETKKLRLEAQERLDKKIAEQEEQALAEDGNNFSPSKRRGRPPANPIYEPPVASPRPVYSSFLTNLVDVNVFDPYEVLGMPRPEPPKPPEAAPEPEPEYIEEYDEQNNFVARYTLQEYQALLEEMQERGEHIEIEEGMRLDRAAYEDRARRDGSDDDEDDEDKEDKEDGDLADSNEDDDGDEDDNEEEDADDIYLDEDSGELDGSDAPRLRIRPGRKGTPSDDDEDAEEEDEEEYEEEDEDDDEEEDGDFEYD